MTDPTLTEKSKISIKCRNAKGEWLPVAGIGGLSLRQIFQKLEGTEAVCEYHRGERVWYFSGTEQWKKVMKKRGTSIGFAEALTLLDSVNPGWLEEVPVTEKMEEMMKLLGQPEPCLAMLEEL